MQKVFWGRREYALARVQEHLADGWVVLPGTVVLYQNEHATTSVPRTKNDTTFTQEIFLVLEQREWPLP